MNDYWEQIDPQSEKFVSLLAESFSDKSIS